MGGVNFDGFAVFEGLYDGDIAGFEGEEGANADDYFDGVVVVFGVALLLVVCICIVAYRVPG